MNDIPKKQDEVLYSSYPSTWRHQPLTFLLAVVLIFAFGLGVIMLLYLYVVSRRNKLEIRSAKIEWTQGIISKKYVELRIGLVSTVKVEQNVLQRMFKSGSVKIYSAGDLPEIEILGLPYPTRIREIIKQQQELLAK